MAREDWQLQRTDKDKIEDAYQKFALHSWFNEPMDVTDPYLRQAFDKGRHEALSSLLSWTSPLGAFLGKPGLLLTASSAAAEAAYNERVQKNLSTLNQLRKELGREPTQEEFNAAYAKLDSLPELSSAGLDVLFGKVPAIKKGISLAGRNLARTPFRLGIHAPSMKKGYAIEYAGNEIQDAFTDPVATYLRTH